MHNLRCEHSTSEPKRCRCNDCHGAQHGIQAGETGTYADEQAPGVLTPDPIPSASNLGIHRWFEAWVSA